MVGKVMVVAVILFGGFSMVAFGEQTVTAVKIDTPPIIDGYADDRAWSQDRYTITHDNIANIDMKIQAVYTAQKLYLLVRFADPDESRCHKFLVWHPDQEMYLTGPDREDCVVIKWAMGPDVENLSVYSDTPYRADIWFWKANRTDPAGYADDKYQILSNRKTYKSRALQSVTGKPMFLQRIGDSGRPAYKASVFAIYQGDKMPQYMSQEPTGSRADVQAKGRWQDRQWCVEFARNLVTGHDDDQSFDPQKQYLFGISRYEIAGQQPNPAFSQPLYNAGDVNEKLTLVFKP